MSVNNCSGYVGKAMCILKEHLCKAYSSTKIYRNCRPFLKNLQIPQLFKNCNISNGEQQRNFLSSLMWNINTTIHDVLSKAITFVWHWISNLSICVILEINNSQNTKSYLFSLSYFPSF